MANSPYKNTLWQVFEKILSMIASLLVAVYLARAIGPHGYGAFSYLLALYVLASPLATLGLNALVTRELVNSPSQHSQIVSSVALVRVCGAVVAAFILVGWAWVGTGFSSVAERWGLTALAGGLVLQSFQFIEFYFHAKEYIKPVIIMRLGVLLFFTVTKLTAISMGASVVQVIYIFALEYAVIGAGYFVLLCFRDCTIRFNNINWRYAVKLLRQSSWLVLSGLAAVTYLKIDQVMLSNILGHEQTGLYAVAARLSEVWYFLATAMVISFFPTLLRYRSQNVEMYWSKLQGLNDVLCWSAVMLSFLINMIALPLVTRLFGSDYAGAADILAVHIWASVFVFMRALASKWLLAEGLLKFSLLSHGLGALTNILFNWWLIPAFGGLGAAWATLIAYIVASIVVFYMVASTRPMAVIMTKSLVAPITRALQYRRS